MRNVEPRESEKYQSLEVLFEPFIQLPFDDLPDEIKSQWELAEMTHSWDSITPNQRRGLAKDHDSIYDPARRVRLIAGELIDEMNADAWWLMESVLPLHAAMLLLTCAPNSA